jgi:Peptidase M15
MITREDYFMGRDNAFPLEMSTDIERNAARLLPLVNLLLTRFGQHPKVTSGWRPPKLNAATPGAALNSKHMLGQAIDLADPDGDLDDWLTSEAGLLALEEYGLWMEHPAATKGWAHLQSVPPKSRKRVFYP